MLFVIKDNLWTSPDYDNDRYRSEISYGVAMGQTIVRIWLYTQTKRLLDRAGIAHYFVGYREFKLVPANLTTNQTHDAWGIYIVDIPNKEDVAMVKIMFPHCEETKIRDKDNLLRDPAFRSRVQMSSPEPWEKNLHLLSTR